MPDNRQVLQESVFLRGCNRSEVRLLSLFNENGCSVQLTNYGARIVNCWVPDKNGDFRDVVLGHGTLKEYMDTSPNYYGAICGRFANRIADGRFNLGGESFQLATNNGKNHLHGGASGFESKIWNIEKHEDTSATFSYLSSDGEEGYPGSLTVRVKYTLSRQNALRIQYEATTDQATILNLTNHAYFNLKGEGQGDILDHQVQIAASHITELREGSIPTGRLLAVAGTPLNFEEPQRIGSRINEAHPQMQIGGGYDHNYVLHDVAVGSIASVWEATSGIKMKVYTDQPGVQFYTTNSMGKNLTGKSGSTYVRHGAFCLETQHYPDSPNHAAFPSVLLNPGQVFSSYTEYQFSVG